jgi:NADH:ubiquinone oxidoreductase subunit K
VNGDSSQWMAIFGVVVVLIQIIGLYSVVTTRNLVRALIGLVILTKSVTLLLVIAGNWAGRIALAQSLVVTLIIVEVAVVVVAIGIILCLYQQHRSLDTTLLRSLKG